MNLFSFDEIENITDSRYSLVMLASKRAREIVDGESSLLDLEMEEDCHKPVSIALEEIKEGKVRFGTEEEELLQEAQMKELRDQVRRYYEEMMLPEEE